MKLDDGLSFFNHNDVVLSPAIKLSANSLGESDEDLKTEKDFNDDNQLKEYMNISIDFENCSSDIKRKQVKLLDLTLVIITYYQIQQENFMDLN